MHNLKIEIYFAVVTENRNLHSRLKAEFLQGHSRKRLVGNAFTFAIFNQKLVVHPQKSDLQEYFLNVEAKISFLFIFSFNCICFLKIARTFNK
jgi:hypothetical protein